MSRIDPRAGRDEHRGGAIISFVWLAFYFLIMASGALLQTGLHVGQFASLR